MAFSKLVTLKAFNRQEASTFLRVRLGPAYGWLKLLEHWSKRDNTDGLRGSDVRCEPDFPDGKQPMYTRENLEHFIEQACEVVGELAPAPLTLHTFELDADSLRLPWPMRRARRCTKSAAPLEH